MLLFESFLFLYSLSQVLGFLTFTRTIALRLTRYIIIFRHAYHGQTCIRSGRPMIGPK